MARLGDPFVLKEEWGTRSEQLLKAGLREIVAGRIHKSLPQVLALEFGARITGNLLAGAIASHDASVRVEYNNQSAGRLENCRGEITLAGQLGLHAVDGCDVMHATDQHITLRRVLQAFLGDNVTVLA